MYKTLSKAIVLAFCCNTSYATQIDFNSMPLTLLPVGDTDIDVMGGPATDFTLTHTIPIPGFYSLNAGVSSVADWATSPGAVVGDAGDVFANTAGIAMFLDADPSENFYLGLQGFEGCALCFGWLEVAWDTDTNSITLLAGAYDDSGATIGVGVTAIPEPSSLGTVAIAGLMLFPFAYRCRKIVKYKTPIHRN